MEVASLHSHQAQAQFLEIHLAMEVNYPKRERLRASASLETQIILLKGTFLRASRAIEESNLRGMSLISQRHRQPEAILSRTRRVR